MTEKEIERYFCKRVRALGGFAYKFRSITQIGVADRIACMPNGEAWFVEIKQPNGTAVCVAAYIFRRDGAHQAALCVSVVDRRD
jgi:hypothetical protein